MEDVQLFLMEFLVDTVNIPTIRAIHDEILPARTCVSFQILDLPPLNIYQESSVDGCACSDKEPQVFKKGKSCLFALPKMALRKPLCSFPVTMSVYKELPPGVLPDVMLIGTHQIQTRELMNALLMRQIFEREDTCRTMKNNFRITTATGQCVGEVTAFIRVSCFGKKIVTQFQIPRSGKPYLFKGVDDSAVYQCKRACATTAPKEKIECACVPKKINDGSGEAAEILVPEKCRRDDSCSCSLPSAPRRKKTVRKCGCITEERL